MPDSDGFVQPHSKFEWRIYANATFAGLAVLIPIIGLDWAFEEIFRRRMAASIAKYRQQQLADVALTALNSSDTTCKESCLMLPLLLTVGLIKKLSKKILYFLTVKEAADKLSYYWHRAFLMDYMLLVGHLETEESAKIARQAMDEVLENIVVSPLRQVAGQVISSSKHILRTLRRAQKGVEDEVVRQNKLIMLEHWREFEVYFQQLAQAYIEQYQEITTQQEQEVQL